MAATTASVVTPQNATVDFNLTTGTAAATTPLNPWAGPLGPLQYFEILYLSAVVVLGSLGNLTVIFSIISERRVHSHGNIFVINLAVADLLVTGFVVPTVIANVASSTNALSFLVCQIVGYTVTVTCTCSLCNLMVIAINRYCAVVHNKTYTKYFTRKRIYLMILGSWVVSNSVSMPTLLGWGAINYDYKMMLCSWDDTKSQSYTIFLTLFAIFVPLLIIAFCYYKLFSTVRSSGRWVRSLSASSGVLNTEQNRRSERKERNLLQTLATTVAFFCVCWLPYGLAILIDAPGIPAQAKKVIGWMGLSNSAVNFVIYGAMNPVFRRGYRNLFLLIFTCRPAKRNSSTGLHASQQHSDSFYKSRRKGSSGLNTPNNTRITNKWSPNIAAGRNSVPQGYYNSTRSTPASTPQMMRNNNGNHHCFGRRPVSAAGASANPAPVQPPVPAPVAEPTPPPPTAVPSTSKKILPASIGAFKRPGSLLRRGKSNNNRAAAEISREARRKRNSLMLLQIQTSDDENDSPLIHRRTQSEIPNGKPVLTLAPPPLLHHHKGGSSGGDISSGISSDEDIRSHVSGPRPITVPVSSLNPRPHLKSNPSPLTIPVTSRSSSPRPHSSSSSSPSHSSNSGDLASANLVQDESQQLLTEVELNKAPKTNPDREPRPNPSSGDNTASSKSKERLLEVSSERDESKV